MVFGKIEGVGHKVDYSQLVQTINTSSFKVKVIDYDKDFEEFVKLLGNKNNSTTL